MASKSITVSTVVVKVSVSTRRERPFAKTVEETRYVPTGSKNGGVLTVVVWVSVNIKRSGLDAWNVKRLPSVNMEKQSFHVPSARNRKR